MDPNLPVVSAATTAAPAHPWRRVARTLLAAVCALATLLPAIVDALGASRAVPVVAGALAVAGAVTRALALPETELVLRRFAPWLSASDVPADKVVTQVVEVHDPHPCGQKTSVRTAVVAGDAHVDATGVELLSTDAVAKVVLTAAKDAASVPDFDDTDV